MRKSKLPTFMDGHGCVDGESIDIGSDYWHNTYLPSIRSFRYESKYLMSITVRRKKNKPYWNAFRKVDGKLRCKYVGKHKDVSFEKLELVLESLNLQPKDYLTLRR